MVSEQLALFCCDYFEFPLNQTSLLYIKWKIIGHAVEFMSKIYISPTKITLTLDSPLKQATFSLNRN